MVVWKVGENLPKKGAGKLGGLERGLAPFPGCRRCRNPLVVPL